MKKTGLIIVIAICLIVFLTTLSAGVALTIRSVGWASLMDSTQLEEKIERIFDDLDFANIFNRERQSFSIDELRTSDLTGIKRIKISGVSEKMQVSTGGNQLEARLSGTYLSFGKELKWIAEKQNDVLLIYADYPTFGMLGSDLNISVRIPAEYSGEVQLNTVSGSSMLDTQVKTAWTAVTMKSVSGDLNITRAEFPAVNFSTVSGRVEFSQCTAKVSGDTVSGDVEVVWNEFGESRLKTISGKVDVIMPKTSDCSITYKTVSGSFKNNGLSVQISEQSKRSLSGTLNAGTQKLAVETVSGDFTMSAP